jgi:hypothetical protein
VDANQLRAIFQSVAVNYLHSRPVDPAVYAWVDERIDEAVARAATHPERLADAGAARNAAEAFFSLVFPPRTGVQPEVFGITAPTLGIADVRTTQLSISWPWPFGGDD